MADCIIAQGQSNATPEKERGLQSAFEVNLRVYKHSPRLSNYRKYNKPYIHFDLNCGSGWNNKVNCIGSPIAFINAAHNIGVDNYYAGFCDNQKSSIYSLLNTLQEKNKNCYCFHGDNQYLIDSIPYIIESLKVNPQFALGMILSDPDGSEIHLDRLEQLSQKCPRMDFVLNWNSTQFKRNIKAFGDHRPRMEDAIRMLNKKHWLIRRPLGKWQWSLLIGRNYDSGDHRNEGFYPLYSPSGESIFNRCNYTTEEIKQNQSSCLFQQKSLF